MTADQPLAATTLPITAQHMLDSLKRHSIALAGSAAARKVAVAAGVLFALPVFGILTAFGVASDSQTDKIARTDVVQSVAVPDGPLASQADPAPFRASERIQKGDSVATLLSRLAVNDREAFEFLRTTPEAKMIFQLRPGRTVQAVTDSAGELQSLLYLHSQDKALEVKRVNAKLVAKEKALTSSARTVYKTGTIKTSLFGATDEAGIPDAVATQIARIFSTDIDFHVDLRKGDTFGVVYEMLYHEGEFLRPGRVISAEFVNNGKRFEAFLFTDSEGNDGYYAADGSNRAKSFLRSPLAFSRVSSGFGGRVHPIFKQWRAHTGVDFAAPKGTPTWATADGIVEFAGVKGGYGTVVEIRHSGSISTLYAHLSGIASGVRKGARVTQGQTIGFVGSSGWATGPHLHYEFKIAGRHQDPMRVALPKAEPLAAKYFASFKSTASVQAEKLSQLRVARPARFE